MIPDQAWLRFSEAAPVSRETFERLEIYHNLLLKWSKIKNLVAPNTLQQVWSRHFADSLQLRPLMQEALSIVDLGSGAGFPGLILAIEMRSRKGAIIHLIESDNRKCAFLREVIRETDAPAIVHCGRIEEVATTLPTPDLVTARALASLDKLISLSAPLISAGATGVFLKGQGFQSELTVARSTCTFDFDVVQSRTDPAAGIILVRSAASASHSRT